MPTEKADAEVDGMRVDAMERRMREAYRRDEMIVLTGTVAGFSGGGVEKRRFVEKIR